MLERRTLFIAIHRKRIYLVPLILIAIIALYKGVSSQKIVVGEKGVQSFLFTDDYDWVRLDTQSQVSIPNQSQASSPYANAGHSKIITSSIDSTIECVYIIGDTEDPSVGVKLMVEDTTDFIDLSQASKLVITLDPQKTDNLNVTLFFHLPQFTLMNVPQTHRYAITELTIHPDQSTYYIPIRTLHTPLWWYALNRTSRSLLPEKIPYERCTGISFSNHELAPRGDTLTMAIESISATPSLWPIGFTAGIVSILYLLGYFALYRGCVQKELSYSPISLTSYLTQESAAITAFVGLHYHSPDLTISHCAKETGLSEDRIRTVLKKSLGKTMKAYVTDLRMAESQRLLRETDRPIVEIALAVGYKHVSSFNHIFKEVVHLSPREFRKKERL